MLILACQDLSSDLRSPEQFSGEELIDFWESATEQLATLNDQLQELQGELLKIPKSEKEYRADRKRELNILDKEIQKAHAASSNFVAAVRREEEILAAEKDERRASSVVTHTFEPDGAGFSAASWLSNQKQLGLRLQPVGDSNDTPRGVLVSEITTDAQLPRHVEGMVIANINSQPCHTKSYSDVMNKIAGQVVTIKFCAPEFLEDLGP